MSRILKRDLTTFIQNINLQNINTFFFSKHILLVKVKLPNVLKKCSESDEITIFRNIFKPRNFNKEINKTSSNITIIVNDFLDETDALITKFRS